MPKRQVRDYRCEMTGERGEMTQADNNTRADMPAENAETGTHRVTRLTTAVAIASALAGVAAGLLTLMLYGV